MLAGMYKGICDYRTNTVSYQNIGQFSRARGGRHLLKFLGESLHDIEIFRWGRFLIKAFVSCKPRLNIIKQAISSCEGPGTISQPFIGWVKLEKPIPRAIPRIPSPNCKIHNHEFRFYSTFARRLRRSLVRKDTRSGGPRKLNISSRCRKLKIYTNSKNLINYLIGVVFE